MSERIMSGCGDVPGDRGGHAGRWITPAGGHDRQRWCGHPGSRDGDAIAACGRASGVVRATGTHTAGPYGRVNRGRHCGRASDGSQTIDHPYTPHSSLVADVLFFGRQASTLPQTAAERQSPSRPVARIETRAQGENTRLTQAWDRVWKSAAFVPDQALRTPQNTGAEPFN